MATPEKVKLECPDCGRIIERNPKRIGTGRCRFCAYNQATIRRFPCKGCGKPIETKDPDQAYCTRECFQENYEPDEVAREAVAEAGRKRLGKKNPYYKHGRRAGTHERKLHDNFTVKKKGEEWCRVCGSTSYLHAHHMVPRSKSLAGKYDLRNCMVLCASCHKSWHNRTLFIPRKLITEEEFAFMETLVNSSWLDERYPDA